MTKITKNEKGSILVGSILIMTLLLGLAVSLSSLVLSTSLATQRSYQNIIAISQAEAAIEKTMWELNSGETPTCDPNCTLDNAYVETVITTIDSENKEIVAEAYVPTFTNYQAKRTIKVTISATPDSQGIAFNYAIQAGTGGINISGSSEVKGNLYSNGNITVSGSAEVEDPGETWAVGTITETSKTEGPDHPGSPAIPLPTVDTNMWQNLSKTGGTITGDYSPPNSGSYTNFGPKEITGNLSMSSSGQKVNLTGPLYIQGNLNISGGSFKLDDSFGDKGTVVLVDGTISISGSPKFFANSGGGYIMFISLNTTGSAISYTGSGDGEKLALFAPDGTVSMSGSGKIVSMSGKTLNISGSGNIEYESGLASTEFTGGPGGSWTRKSWQKIQ